MSKYFLSAQLESIMKKVSFENFLTTSIKSSQLYFHVVKMQNNFCGVAHSLYPGICQCLGLNQSTGIKTINGCLCLSTQLCIILCSWECTQSH